MSNKWWQQQQDRERMWGIAKTVAGSVLAIALAFGFVTLCFLIE
jgi:hypothetical protein